MSLRRMGLGLAGVAVLLAGTSGVSARAGQSQGTGSIPLAPTILPIGVDPLESKDPVHIRIHEQQMAVAADERHKRMVSDSDKLLQLATELKAEVDKSTKNEMSISAIKKAAEIEKLAHDVKEKMKGD